jgi:hypothetical protein
VIPNTISLTGVDKFRAKNSSQPHGKAAMYHSDAALTVGTWFTARVKC